MTNSDQRGISLVSNREKDIEHLIVSQVFGDKEWGNTFGAVQRQIRESRRGCLQVDLRSTMWIDPGPLIALIITVEEWRFQNKAVEVVLPNPREETDDGYELALFQLFLEREGFLAALVGVRAGSLDPRAVEQSIPTNTKVLFGQQSVNNYEELTRSVLRGSPALTAPLHGTITARVVDIRECNPLPDFVDELVEEANNRGFKKHFNGSYSDARRALVEADESRISSLLFSEELRQILIELLENVREHAFTDGFDRDTLPHLVGIYGRLRPGLTTVGISHQRDALKYRYYKENLDSPLLNRTHALAYLGFVELFVGDSGIGLARHLKNELRLDSRHAMRVFFQQLASSNGYSRFGSREDREKQGKSALPGLKHLTEVLDRDSGFLRILSFGEWLAVQPPLAEGVSSASAEVEDPVVGTHALVRISMGEPKSLPKEHWRAVALQLREGQDLHRDPVLEAWSDGNASRKRWRRVRFRIEDQAAPDRLEASTGYGHLQTIDVGEFGRAIECVLWRPPRGLHRNAIRESLIKLGKKYPRSHLVIADQDNATALMTAWTLRTMALYDAGELVSLTIVSSHLAVIEFAAEPSGDAIRWSPRNVPGLSVIQPDKGISLTHVVAVLRQLDGEIFWRAIASHADSFSLLLQGLITWTSRSTDGKSLELREYLDFPQTLNLKTCRWVYRRSLGRFLAYISPSESPEPSDHPVDPILNGFLYHRNTSEVNRPFVSLGSVLVSAGGLARLRERIESFAPQGPPVIVHFLHHPSAVLSKDGATYSLLPWLPRTQGQSSLPLTELKRVTDTAAVGPGGTGFWRIIRADKGGSLYGVSPDTPDGVTVPEAYAFWQSRSLLRIGHWHHGSRHDLLGLDVVTALKLDRLNLYGQAWRFLFSHLRRLDPQYQAVFNFQACDLLVCMANEATMLITERAFEKLDFLEERTVFLSSVQRQRSAMRLRLAPIAVLRLQNRLRKIEEAKSGEGPPRVLLLDSNFGSVRELEELKSLIRESGAGDVQTIALLDRTRVPNDPRAFEEGWHIRNARLWRLDVGSLSPSLGPQASESCPLCRAVARIQDVLRGVPEAQSLLRERLQRWIEVGRLRTLSKTAATVGLQPIKLPTTIFAENIFESAEPDSQPQIVSLNEAAALATLLVETVTIAGKHEEVVDQLASVAAPEGTLEEQTQAVAAQIYVLVAQGLLLRNDVDHERKRLTYSKLLSALAESPTASPATALGGLVISNLGPQMVKVLRTSIPDILKSHGGNLDFDLAVAAMLREQPFGASKAFQGLRLAEVPQLVREAFLVVGLSSSDSHHTKLRRLLARSAIGEIAKENWQRVAVLVGELVDSLARLAESETYLPESATLDEIDNWWEKLATLQSELSDALAAYLVGWDNDEEVIRIDDAFSGLWTAIYGDPNGPRTLQMDLRKWFTVGLVDFADFMRARIALRKNSESYDAVSIEQIGRSDFQGEKSSHFAMLHLDQVSRAIEEFLANAFENAAKTREAWVRWSVEPAKDERAILLTISNSCQSSAVLARMTSEQRIIEYLGGHIDIIPPEDVPEPSYIVKIRLPSVVNLVG